MLESVNPKSAQSANAIAAGIVKTMRLIYKPIAAGINISDLE
jgi:hypothetical protein